MKHRGMLIGNTRAWARTIPANTKMLDEGDEIMSVLFTLNKG